MIHDIVVPVKTEAGRPASPAESYAISLASLFGAHLTGIGSSSPRALSGMLSAEIPAEIIEEIRRRADTAARAALSAFEQRASSAGVLHQIVSLRDEPAEFANTFSTRTRAFDIAVLPQPEADDAWARELVEAVLFDSGRPALVVPFIQRNEARFGFSLLGTAAGRRLERYMMLCRSCAARHLSRSSRSIRRSTAPKT